MMSVKPAVLYISPAIDLFLIAQANIAGHYAGREADEVTVYQDWLHHSAPEQL